MLDKNYETEGSDPKIKSVNHVDEEINSNADYAKMELPCQGTMFQRSMNHQVVENKGLSNNV